MRYTRLRRQIESGTLIGTHGTPFLSSSSDNPSSSSNKRKRLGGSSEKDDDDESEGDMGLKNEKGLKSEKEGKKHKIKVEDGESGWDSGSETTGSEGWDSEDEIPLAKLRKARLSHPPPAPSPITPISSFTQHTIPANQAERQEMLRNRDGVMYVSGKRVVGAPSRPHTVHGASIPRYIPPSEGRAWAGMIPVGNAGLQNSGLEYRAYLGNGFAGVGTWEQGGKPRKSV
jgi:hypothetical protein